jgi:hypothetical protein
LPGGFPGRIRPLVGAVAGVSVLGAGLTANSSATATQVTLVEPLDGQWIGQEQPVVLKVTDRPPAAEGRLAVFIGTSDMTGLCTPQRSGQLRCSPGMLRLPEGEQEIAVYLVKSSSDW